MNMFKALKEIIFKELKMNMTITIHQIENINKDRNYQRKQMEIKSIITEMKNSLEKFNSKFNMAEGRIRT